MRAECDFSGGKRQALTGFKGRTRISIFIDNAVLEAFRAWAEAAGTGYQTMMNDALKHYLLDDARPLTESRLRAVLSEVLPPPVVERPIARSARATCKRAAG